MIFLILGVAAFTMSIPPSMAHSRFKRRYRKSHPSCAWIPLKSNGWMATLLQAFAGMSILFFIDPQSWASFSGAFMGTFGG